ncbi:hypothetical protein NIES4071_91150 [Calothrix sp. NIES-4071]|nr:hypothetical protein NIES4071_91150 [Calothrix sp. NIES-4071]BAZ63382.1 hypothetical protein NIES4105_91080 [Calothrix sp. NIES-4105]
MADEVKINASEVSHDAQLLADNVAEGVEKAPKVDFDADYELAKEMSVAPIDNTEEGQKAAEAAVAPQHKIPEAQDMRVEAPATGNPSDYMSMASEVGTGNEAAGNVDDDLVKKALELGQPGQ